MIVAVFPVMAQRNAPLVVETDPEKEKATFVLDPALEVNLFAGDPMLAKPIQIAWDSRGRLWVACSETYPQIKPGQKANDKILILEDTDGDGKADKTTVFAEGLLIPTGIEPDLNGAYVADSTELVYLQDTDGDGKADKRTVVLSGFGTEDTHHLLHTIRFGPDGRLYFNQSIYIHSHLETPHGPKRLGGGGTWALRTRTLELDILMRGLVNPWGLSWDRNGQVFETDGAGGEGINYIIPGGWYFTAVGARRIFPGLNPGSPKDCGLEWITGNHLPQGWDGNLVTNDFRGHRVCRYVLSDDGAGFQAREAKELIRSNHPAFRPVDVRQGPDGAIYIADWFNPIIQHGEVDFRDPRRDKTHGRIWRLTPKGKTLPKKPSLVDAPPQALAEAMQSDLGWTRHHARMVMRERNPEAMVTVLQEVASRAHEPALMDVLFATLAVDRPDFALVSRLLTSSDPSIRAGALRAFSWAKTTPSQREQIVEKAKDDPHPRVRLEVIRLLGRDPRIENLKLALGYLAKPLDRFEEYALWLTVNDLKDLWAAEIEGGRLGQWDARSLVYAVRATAGPQLGRSLRDLARGVKDLSGLPLLEALLDLGDAEDVRLVWSKLPLLGGHPAEALKILTSLEGAANRLGGKIPTLDAGLVKPYLENPATLAVAARVAGAYRLAGAGPWLQELAGNEKAETSRRVLALEGLVRLGGGEVEAFLSRLSASKSDPVAVDALLALARLNPEASADRVVTLLASPDGSAQAPRVAREFAARKNGPSALSKALAKASLPRDTARVLIRELSNTPGTESLRDQVKKSGGLEKAARGSDPAEVAAIVALSREKGDPALGEAIFRQSRLQCFKCHAIGSAGGLVGPELGSLGGSAQPDYILESLLLPDKAVKENYHTTVATTNDGKVYAGIRQKLDDRELVLRNAENQLLVLPRSRIEEMGQGKSLMPAGLVEELTDLELAHLVRFLSELGKVPERSLPREPWVRSYQSLVNNPLSWEMLSHGGPGIFSLKGQEPGLIWQSAIPLVNGELPLSELPSARKDVKLVRCDFEVSVPGKFQFQANDWAGIRAFLGNGKFEGESGVQALQSTSLDKGRHTLILAIDPGARTKGLKLLVGEVPGDPGRIRPLAP